MPDYNNYNNYYELIKLIEQSNKQGGKDYDLNLINKAYQTAFVAHVNQKRISGADYIMHPVSVAYILVELGMDSQTIAAALLHDTIEDSPLTKKNILRLFGQEITNLVDGVTKLRQMASTTKEEQQADNIRKMMIAMSHDSRVIIIKLADRLQNMRTIGCMDPQKRRDKSLQNMEVFAPIAHRLGMRIIKDELEDISLKYLDPIAYAEIENFLALRKDDREKFISLIKRRISAKVKPFISDVFIEGRVKSSNEIYKKVYIKGKDIDEIYDIYAVRIIVQTINNCYNVFGLIHETFQPIPKRFKDYISTPKPNMYQSLHTTVLSKEGIPFEVQIRTWEMHRTAEYGIAAHWKYKLGVVENGNNTIKNTLSWVKKMIANYKEIEDSTDVVNNIKLDLVPKEILVLTPKSKVINLPTGATAIDFAYAIHTELGHRMIGAKVNKKIVPISYVLTTGEIIDIINTKDVNRGPSRDWLSIVKTSEARNKIKQWFKKERKEENIIEGKQLTERELRKHNLNIPENKLEEFLSSVIKKHQCKTIADFFAAVGYGGVQLHRLIPTLKNEYEKRNRTKPRPSSTIVPTKNTTPPESKTPGGIIVDGMKGCFARLAKCCNPLPGDEITGFVTKGFGISVHQKSCKNVPQHHQSANEANRWIKCSWCENIETTFETSIEITAHYTNELFTNITKKASAMNLKIKSLNSTILLGDKISIILTVHIKSLSHLEQVIANVSRISGIISVKRM